MRFTESITPSQSIGDSVRMSITSQDVPSFSACSTAFWISGIIAPQPMTVTSFPCFTMRSFLIGMTYSPSGHLLLEEAIGAGRFQEYHWVGIAYRRGQQSLGLQWGRWHHDLQPRDLQNNDSVLSE